MNKLIVILGPTASRKTGLAIKLAKKLNGEIVCADSRQIYKEMAIGTAQPRQFQISNCKSQICISNLKSKTNQKPIIVKEIPHHLFGIVGPDKQFSVAQYQKLAVKTIKDIQKRGKVPFLVGGTAFYIYSVIEGWQFPKSKANLKLRQKLENQSPAQLFKLLQKLDKQRAENIDKNNKRRLVRAIEMAEELGQTPQLQQNHVFDCLILGVKVNQKELEQRIKKRTAKMFKQGLEKEVKTLVKKYGWAPILQNTIGYAEFREFSSPTKKELQALISLHTRQFAKRQMTWFKKDKRIRWVTAKSAKKATRSFLRS